MTEKARYQAPALKKGLEILELLASSAVALTMSDISAALGRSVSEIFRMLQVLEQDGYIARGDDGYRLTNKLFTLGMNHPPIRDLVSTALPVMQALTLESGQSCHLAVASGGDMVVIVAIEAPGLCGFAVRVGYRRPLPSSNSGRILLAFQSMAARTAMLNDAQIAGHRYDLDDMSDRLGVLIANRVAICPSPILSGITDISAPILVGSSARAALTMPFVNGVEIARSLEECSNLIRAAADQIASALSPLQVSPVRMSNHGANHDFEGA